MNDQPQEPKAIRLPLRAILVLPFLAQICAAVGLTGYLSLRNGQKAVNDLAEQLQSETTARVHQQLQSYTAIPHQLNQNNAIALTLETLSLDDPQRLQKTFWGQVKTFDQVAAIGVGAEASGGYIDAARSGDTIIISTTEGFRVGAFNTYATDQKVNLQAQLSTTPDYDARIRPWYTGAVEKGGAGWSSIYTHFASQALGMSATRPAYDEDGSVKAVFATDFLLAGISDFLRTLEIGKTGQALVIERSGLVVANSTQELPYTQVEDEDPERLNAAESQNPVFQAAIGQLIQQSGGLEALEAQQLTFKLNNQKYLRFEI